MDHDECRQLIQDQNRTLGPQAGDRVPRAIQDRAPPMGSRASGGDAGDHQSQIPPDDNVNPADVVESYIYVFVETAQRDANARKAGMQFYTLYPKYDEYPELGHGRRKNFHAVPEEAVPEEAVPEEAAPEPASVGTP